MSRAPSDGAILDCLTGENERRLSEMVHVVSGAISLLDHSESYDVDCAVISATGLLVMLRDKAQGLRDANNLDDVRRRYGGPANID